MPVSTKVSGLIISAVINIALEILCFALYSVFRKQPSNANIYFARHVLIDEKRRRKGSNRFALENFLPSAGWVKKAWLLSDEEIMGDSGLDTLVFLRIYVFCLRFFGICTLLGLFVLVPVNYIYGQIDIDTISSDTLDKFAISNVTDGSNRLWVHFCILYCISFLAYIFLYLEYSHITRKRIEYLYSTQPEPDQFTVLVRAIPKSSQQTYSQQVEEFFHTYYPDTYLLQNIAYANGKWEHLLGEVQWLLKEVQFLNSLPARERVPRRMGFLGILGKKEDPLNLYLNRLEELQKDIKDSQAKFVQAKKEIPVSFVSFKTRWDAAVVAQTWQTPNPFQWVTEWAPEPRDVNWQSLSIHFSHLWLIRLVVGVIFFCITILYFIPAGLVYTLATLNNLRTWFPFTQQILSIPLVGSLINGYLPSLLISILYFFIPPLMLFLTRFEGYPSYSSQERKTCGKVFLFVVANSFFLVTYGSLINLFNQAIESPRQIPALLASAVASQANFFMNFVMTRGWTGYAVEILQPYLLLSGFFWRRVFRKGQYGPYVESLPYYRTLPNFLLFIFIGFMYTMIAPLMLPFLMIYFSVGYIVYRNQILNRYEPAYETGGQYWPHVHNRVIFSVFMMQVICIGMFGVKNKAMASTLSIPLLPLTVLFNHYCNLRFYPAFRNISVQITLSKDIEDEQKVGREDILQRLQNAYLCPPLQLVETDIAGSSSYEPLLSSQQHSEA